ncbi:hypothetical protein QN277_025397 [Acacia crassicarpa]|uniref:Uncharacterized protein n=1 Tax=Acacia crassicarpa TaxID=499986 RepID=A0AAE1MJJ8_9FABA|nr:hypothetical protein QN277_025397 [Acacia crassicarpa]
MGNASPCPTPMTASKSISAYSGDLLANLMEYRNAVGALQYLCNIRLDINFSIGKLSQFLSQPTTEHWKAMQRVLRYLRGTIHYGIHIKPAYTLDLAAFSNANWASCPDDRRFVGGYYVFLGNSLVTWSSKKQAVVSRSSCELKYRSLANTASELNWIKSLLTELSLRLKNIPTIWCDNTNAAALAANPVHHARTKHIEIDVHFVRDQVLSKLLKVQYVPTEFQLVDCLTKPLHHSRFWFLRDKLGVTVAPVK